MRALRSTIWIGSKPYSARNVPGSISRVVDLPMRLLTSST